MISETRNQRTSGLLAPAGTPTLNDREQKPPKPLLDRSEWTSLASELSLAARQTQVLWLLLNGYNDKQIAPTLRVKAATVRVHFGRLFRRFNVSDRTTLVVELFAEFRDWERSHHRQNATRHTQ